MKPEERQEPEAHENSAFDDASESFAPAQANQVAGGSRMQEFALPVAASASVNINMDERAGTSEEDETEPEAEAEGAGRKPRAESFASSSADSLGNSTTYTASSSSNSSRVEEPPVVAEPLPAGDNRGSEQFAISWHKLDYVVTSNWYELTKQRKPILDNLSGCFRSGELSAVLGPSGAGKSTFIDCLLGKRDRGLSGRTRVSFENPLEEAARRRSRPLKIATIPQEDHLMESLTVTETFMFASKIKNAHLSHEQTQTTPGKGTTNRKPFDHFANVQRVIQQLNLASCASLRCNSLSGGQYKRVSIGQELLSRPDLLILDEPTSGLDSVTCYQTVKALRQLIESSPYPMAIVATIHQPDIEVFELFHKAYVLAAGGRAIYEGPTGAILDTVKLALEGVEARRKSELDQLEGVARPFKSSLETSNSLEGLRNRLDESGEHFSRLNPARLIVELAANEYGYEITKAMGELQASQFCGGGDIPESRNKDANLAKFDYELNDPANRKPELDKLLCLVAANVNQRRSAGVYLKHLLLHCRRSWLTIVRDPMLFSLQVLLHIMVPLLISYSFQGERGDACPKIGPLDVIEEAYRKDGGNVLEDLQRELRVVFENLGYMFFQIYVIIFAAVCVTSLTYPLIMHVLLKEYRNGWYSMSSYFIGRTLADLPVPTFNVFLAMAISYHLTGQPLSPYAWRFLCVASLTVLATLVAQTQGLMFGALLMNMPQSAVFVAPASTAPLVVVSGFLIRIQNLPAPLQLLSNFSYFTHLLNGFIVARYGFDRCPCREEDFAIESGHKIPEQARALMNIWVDTFADDYGPANLNSSRLEAGEQRLDLVGNMVDTITRAKTFGYQLTSCDQVKPFTMLDYQLDDIHLYSSFAVLLAMLFAFRWLTYLTLSWKIGSSI